MIGLALMLIGAFAAAFFIVASWSLGVGIFAFFVGLAYTIAGLVTQALGWKAVALSPALAYVVRILILLLRQ